MKLNQWMERRRVGDAELAEAVGVARATISRLRRDKMLPSLDLARRIYVATGGQVGPNDLVELPELTVRRNDEIRMRSR